MMPAVRTYARDRMIVLPGDVRFHTLRDVVVLLSDRNYNQELRRNFYAHSPIPGAIWANAPNNPILMKADEIMPANYDADALQTDVNDFDRMMAWLQTKLPKFVTTERIDFLKKGEASMLKCNGEENLRYPDRKSDEEL